jgi:hypothetical protein
VGRLSNSSSAAALKKNAAPPNRDAAMRVSWPVALTAGMIGLMASASAAPAAADSFAANGASTPAHCAGTQPQANNETQETGKPVPVCPAPTRQTTPRPPPEMIAPVIPTTSAGLQGGVETNTQPQQRPITPTTPTRLQGGVETNAQPQQQPPPQTPPRTVGQPGVPTTPFSLGAVENVVQRALEYPDPARTPPPLQAQTPTRMVTGSTDIPIPGGHDTLTVHVAAGLPYKEPINGDPGEASAFSMVTGYMDHNNQVYVETATLRSTGAVIPVKRDVPVK